MSKKEENLEKWELSPMESAKIKLMIGEQADILSDDVFNEELKRLSRRVEQVQCKKTHEEIAKALLKKASKLERRINAVIAFQEKVAAHQTMLPSSDYQKPVLNHCGPSTFCLGIINIPISSSNMLSLSSNSGFSSAYVSEYISSDEVILVSMENQNSAAANNSAIPNNRMSTQAEISATIQRKMKERKRKVIKLTEEENYNCSKDCQFPHLPPLPKIPHCPELTEEPKDPPENPET